MRWTLTSRSFGRTGGSAMAWMLVTATAASLAIGGCGDDKKNPFATGNVSVAPQVEGRAAAQTPIPPPAPPGAAPTTAP